MINILKASIQISKLIALTITKCNMTNAIYTTWYIHRKYYLPLAVIIDDTNVCNKKKASPIYDPYVGEVPVRERMLVLGQPVYKVGGPVTFLTAFTSPAFPLSPRLLLGGRRESVQPLAQSMSRTMASCAVGEHFNLFDTHWYCL